MKQIFKAFFRYPTRDDLKHLASQSVVDVRDTYVPEKKQPAGNRSFELAKLIAGTK